MTTSVFENNFRTNALNNSFSNNNTINNIGDIKNKLVKKTNNISSIPWMSIVKKTPMAVLWSVGKFATKKIYMYIFFYFSMDIHPSHSKYSICILYDIATIIKR
ncbi:MAG: hypothetical protein AMDU4_FER2C00058G0005 [Ferroplasma sp. Type II]|jgi:hypothetical protein|uniref:hypothetical protein n=1 Tax=Ferroplasma sp. Type II TaxID=261388 RepID=UPI0003895FF0|nr:hypothetical protein [Ferroplasma sp. Type II]EQB73527.1 MAG: hypothetical protein AMDU4_FER2C00058G0005 [Ferroplasma sp. Type II]HII82665.1 hypothetical protein [Ferroplasma sp.]